MKLFKKSNKPKNLLSFVKTTQDDEEIKKKRIKFINYVGTVGFFILLFYGLLNFYLEDYFIGFLEIVLAFLIIYALWGIKKTENVDFYSSIGLISLFVISLNNFIGGGFEQTGLYWIYAFPLIVFFLKGTRDGLYWMYLFFATILVFSVASFFDYYTLPYTDFTTQMFIISLVLITIFVYIYQKNQESSQRLIAIKNKDLEKANLDLTNFKEAVENSTDGVLFLDQHINVIYTNKAFLDITGYSYGEVVNKNLERFFGDKQTYIDTVEKKIYLKNFQRVVTVVKAKSDKSIDADIQIYPVIYLSKLNFYVAIFRDVSAQKKLERLRGEFVSVISHQLRTPLSSINWTLELLQESKNLSTEEKEYLEDIYQNNSRMVNIVNDLLYYGNLKDESHPLVSNDRIDIVELIQNTKRELSKFAQQENVSMEMNSSSKNILVNANSASIKQAIYNILENAIKYSQPKDTVSIQIESNKISAKISIKDEGIGIPKQDQENLFEKFYRSSESKKETTEGNGLGLFIAKNIIESHGGKITFESVENVGTTFYIELPIFTNNNEERKQEGGEISGRNEPKGQTSKFHTKL